VTRHPTAEWLARQITQAFPWTSAPAYLVRDNNGFGLSFILASAGVATRNATAKVARRLAKKRSFIVTPKI
jgi:hypothetical protein